MLVIDTFSRLDGYTAFPYPIINNFCNFILLMLCPVIPSLWFMYIHYQVFHDWSKARGWFYPLLIVNALNIVLVVISQFAGWLYYIDSKCFYHRGPLFLITVIFLTFLIAESELIVIKNRKSIEKKYYLSLILFPVIPFACAILQIVYYGIPFTLNGVALSALIVFINIQSRSMSIDYLTGAYNRKKLDSYMQKKISMSNETKTFSSILIDIDDFKYINDTYGHNMGDYALETSVMILKNCLKESDMVARFGGDEFCVVLDVSNADNLKKIVNRINKALKIYNEYSNKLYKICFSMGFAVYDCKSHMNALEFQKHIDSLMYKNKRAKKVKAVKDYN